MGQSMMRDAPEAGGKRVPISLYWYSRSPLQGAIPVVVVEGLTVVGATAGPGLVVSPARLELAT